MHDLLAASSTGHSVLRWLKDYGAVIAATVAAGVAILNTWRERQARNVAWLRDLRLPRYVAFVRAAYRHREEIFWDNADADPELSGPEPKDRSPYEARHAFDQELAELSLVGPSGVVEAAWAVQFSMWNYHAQLEENPSDYGQKRSSRAIDAFINEAQKAIDVELTTIPRDFRNYRAWLTTQTEFDEAEDAVRESRRGVDERVVEAAPAVQRARRQRRRRHSS